MFAADTSGGSGIQVLVFIVALVLMVAVWAWRRWGGSAWLGKHWWAAGWSGQGWNGQGLRKLFWKIAGLATVGAIIALLIYRRSDDVQATCFKVQVEEAAGYRPGVLDSLVCEIP